MNGYVLAVDQGTTSSRAILFDKLGNIVSMAQYPITQHYPSPGWVEHDPMEILSTELLAMEEVYEKSGLSPTDIAAIGITNQRETTIIWDKATGKPVSNAIVWQCRRTAGICETLKADGLSDTVLQKTGLLIDPYFSGTKIRWILDQDPTLQRRAEQGELLFGNVESWLIWNLTGGAAHVTDYSNASRTMLFDIDKLCWDEELCQLLKIPMSLLPTPVGNSQIYGTVKPGITGLEKLAGVPVCGAAGDQQAALFGQTCFTPGEAKNTYGTGCFLLMNIGEKPMYPNNGLLTTIAWGLDGKVEYALEGSVFVAGAAIQWLRDELKVVDQSPDSEYFATRVDDTNGCYVVPAFTGLTRGVNKYHIIRATLESLAFQSNDVLAAMEEGSGVKLSALKVDGGACKNNFLMQFQSDLIDKKVDRPACVETTAMGASYLAGLAVGFWTSKDDVIKNWALDKEFEPAMDDAKRAEELKGWKKAVNSTLGWAKD